MVDLIIKRIVEECKRLNDLYREKNWDENYRLLYQLGYLDYDDDRDIKEYLSSLDNEHLIDVFLAVCK